MPLMVANIALWRGGGTQIVIVGPQGRADTKALEAVAASHHLPWAVTVPIDSVDNRTPDLPWLQAMRLVDGKAAAYVCSDFTCQAPETDPEALGRQLDEIVRGKRLVL